MVLFIWPVMSRILLYSFSLWREKYPKGDEGGAFQKMLANRASPFHPRQLLLRCSTSCIHAVVINLSAFSSDYLWAESIVAVMPVSLLDRQRTKAGRVLSVEFPCRVQKRVKLLWR